MSDRATELTSIDQWCIAAQSIDALSFFCRFAQRGGDASRDPFLDLTDCPQPENIHTLCNIGIVFDDVAHNPVKATYGVSLRLVSPVSDK
jgi:hypothetical protein